MARLEVDGTDLALRLTRGERIGGFHLNLRVPLASVVSVYALGDAMKSVRGWRMAGINIPNVVALGTRRHGSGYDFVAVHGHRAGVRVDLSSGRFERFVVSVGADEDPSAVAGAVAGAAGVRVSGAG